MSEFRFAQSEYPHQSEIVQQRLAQLENSLGTGEYGGLPVRFLAGIEPEVYIVATSEASPLPAKEYERLRNEARQDILCLVPAGENQAEIAKQAKKQKEWLGNIDTFTVSDFVNYELYKKCATPTLGETAPPKGASYDALANRYASMNNWLEFRFGNATLQEGYYDNETVSEPRLQPCKPSEAEEREQIIFDELIQIAAKHGCAVGYSGQQMSKDINLSMYTQDESALDENGDPAWLPVMGNSPDKIDATLDVISGVSAAIEDGVWMNEISAQESLWFGEDAPSTLNIGVSRVAIRVKDGFIEAREPNYHDSTAQGLLWLMSGASYGLEHGQAGIAEAGYTPATLQLQNFAERTDTFDKHRDLQLQRLIENIAYDSTLQPVLQPAYHADSLATEIFGENVVGMPQADFIAVGIAKGLELQPDGSVRLNAEKFAESYIDRCVAYDRAMNTFNPPSQPLLDAASILIQRHLSRNALKVSVGPAIAAESKWPQLEPADWYDRWTASPIMQWAYGEYTETQAARLEAVATAHYEPLPSGNYSDRYTAFRERLGSRNTVFRQIVSSQVRDSTIVVDDV